MLTTFRCTVIDEDGRRSVREIAARNREHAHLLALIDGTQPLTIELTTLSLVEQVIALVKGSDPGQFFVDLGTVIRSGSNARDAAGALARSSQRGNTSQSGGALRALQTRLTAGERLAPSLRAELAAPRWIQAALEFEPRRGEERHVEVIATTALILSVRARDVGSGMLERFALVLATLTVLGAVGPLGALISGLTIAGLVYASTPFGPIGCALSALRTARFLTILSALLELGASPRRAVALCAEEVGDSRTATALRAAATASQEVAPLDRLLAVAVDLPAVAALILASDLLPAEASARAAADIHTRTLEAIHRVRAIATASALLVLGTVVYFTLGQ